MKNKQNIGNNGKTYQISVCASTIVVKFNEPTQIKTVIKIKPNETSYEIICAADRRQPKNAYFEFLAQPERIIP
jgi:hypothetical protein